MNQPRELTLSRRELLRSATAAAASLGVLPGIGVRAASPGAERRVTVGAHPWVYAATLPQYDITPILDDIFADMRFAGMDGIELIHTALRPDAAPDRIAALSEKHSLPVIGSSFGGVMWDRAQHKQVLEDAEKIVPRLAKLGGRTLGTSVGGVKGKKTPDQLDAQADLLRNLIASCEAHGVVLNLHIHTYEVENDLHDLKGTLARIPNAKLGPDLNWLLRGGVDPVEFLRRYAAQIVFLHLRDQRADGAWSEAMGEGNMDYEAIGKTLQEIGFRGNAVIELAHERGFVRTRPLRESLKMSREFVRRTLGF